MSYENPQEPGEELLSPLFNQSNKYSQYDDRSVSTNGSRGGRGGGRRTNRGGWGWFGGGGGGGGGGNGGRGGNGRQSYEDASFAHSVPTGPLSCEQHFLHFLSTYSLRIFSTLLSLTLLGVVFGLLPYLAVNAAKREQYNQTLYYAAGVCVLVTVPISVEGIGRHLVNWYMPQVQKFVVRILFMVPFYSIQAWFSLFFHGAYEYIRAFRELYEAFVLASFVYYIIELLGGDDQLSLTLRTKDAKYGRHPLPFRLFRSLPLLSWCGADWTMGRQFLQKCKYGTLQYVFVKILATIAIVILQSLSLWTPGVWAWNSAYAYMAVGMNISISYALYCLVKLYYATKESLREWRPVGKFLCIKGIIFFTFWQGFLIQVLHSAGVITSVGGWDSEQVVDGIQDLLICFEMVFFAIAHRYAFPHTDYMHYSLQHPASSTPEGGDANYDNYANGGGLLDPEGNIVVSNEDHIDVEYQPPTVRQLDAPMSVSRALLGTMVPDETITDIARMGSSATTRVMGEGLSAGTGGRSSRVDEEVVLSMDQAEGI